MSVRSKENQRGANDCMQKRLVFSSVSSSVINQHTAEHYRNRRVATYIKNIENCSFKCAIRTRPKEHLKALVLAYMDLKQMLVFSSVSSSVLNRQTVEHYRNRRRATYIKNIEDCSLKCAIGTRSKEH